MPLRGRVVGELLQRAVTEEERQRRDARRRALLDRHTWQPTWQWRGDPLAAKEAADPSGEKEVSAASRRPTEARSFLSTVTPRRAPARRH